MSNGKDLSQHQETALELLIDECGLCAVLQSLSSICDQKSSHILESYNDKQLSKAWASASGVIGLAVSSDWIMEVGCP